MATYGLSRDAILDMPLECFWLLVKNADRIRSEQAMFDLEVAFAAARGAPEELAQSLRQRVGLTHMHEPELDRDGLNRLKRLAGK